MRPKEEILKRRLKKGEKEEKKGRSSWVILLGLFFLSSGLAAIFYLASVLPGFWQKLTSPRIIKPQREASSVSSITNEPTPTTFWSPFLGQELESLINSQDGRYGLYLFDIDKGEFLGVNYQGKFPAASLIKLPIVVTAYREAERRQFDLEAEYRLKEEDKLVGNGSVYLQPEGTTYTYRNLIKLAIEQSDNTASAVIAKALGEEKIQATIDFLDLAGTSYSLHQTTPEDIGRLLVALHQEEILTSAHSQELIGYLSWTIFNDQIPAVLPDSLVIAHKVGFDDQVLHDAAIIFADRGDFVLVIMSQGDSQDKAQTVLEEITEMVWETVKNSKQ